MNVKKLLYLAGLTLAYVIGFFTILLLIALVMLTGVPIHDFNLWRLERSFKAVVTDHPPDSVLIANKKYLGGPDTHGSGRCNYAIGEVRSSSKSKEEIIQTYKNLSVVPILGLQHIPIETLFTDSPQWSATLPLSDWWDELHKQDKSTSRVTYLVYIIHGGFPFFGDYRCDD